MGSAVDGVVFFVGSIFFTSAAALQFVDACNANGNRFRLVAFEPRSPDWWSSAVQLAGTIFFNVSTFDAMKAGLEATEYNRLVWAPDALGSICFLVSGIVAYVAVAGGHIFPARRSRGWWIAAVNLLGCIAFGISAVASYVIPSTGSAVDLARANVTTALGALCFLIGAILLLPSSADAPGAGRGGASG